jgi:molecular chaperone Hsp33
VDVTGPLREAGRLLDLSPVAAGALGRCLAGAALVREVVAAEAERLVIGVSGSGPLARVVAEVESSGRLRGTVSAPQLEIPLAATGELGVKRALGNGVLSVLSQHSGSAYQSHVELDAGRLAYSLARYLDEVAGVRSALLLGVLAESEGISGAGGALVEVLPDADGDTTAVLEERVASVSGIGRILAEGGLEGLLTAVLGAPPESPGTSRELHYGCPCTMAKIKRHLKSLSAEDLEELELADGSLQAECVFCGARYRFRRSELVA